MSKRVLLTGVGGFIGSHFLEHFLENTDWKITGVASWRHKGIPERVLDSEIYQANKERVQIITHDLSAPLSNQAKERIGAVDYIVNLASDSHVDRSITDPVPFVQNNVNLVLNMLEYAREVKPESFIQTSTDEVYGVAPPGVNYAEWSRILPSNPYSGSKAAQEAIAIGYWRTYGVPVVITNCWDMQTKVMAEQGSKSFGELNQGDLVWVLDENEKLVLEPVQEIVRMPGPEEMVRFKSEKVDQLVTPNHRVMFRSPTGSPRRWSKIQEAHAGTFIGLKNRIRIPLTGEWDGEIAAIDSKGFTLGWLCDVFGWFVSEGYFGSGWEICFGAGTKAQQRELQSLLLEGGINSWISGRSVRASNVHLYKLLSACGRGAANKRAPNWVTEMPSEYLRRFWITAMKGDGSQLGRCGAEVYYTKSSTLAEQMAIIGMKIGYAARICQRKTWNPKRTVLSESFIVRFRSASGGDIESRHVQHEEYHGDVWCVRVKSGRVFVNRNGIISLSGQTMNNFGERQDPEKFVPLVMRKVMADEKVILHAYPGCKVAGSRFYLHARNHADAVLHILRNGSPALYQEGYGEPDRFNIVGDREVDNLTMAKFIANIVGKPLKYEMLDSHFSRPGHDTRYALDGSKLRSLGWKAPVDFEHSLDATIRWTLRNPSWLR